MKLPLALLKKVIDVPTENLTELRHILDDLGLEVKDILEEKTGTVFNIETLANRGDHLYVTGVARELSGRFLTPVRYPQLASELPAKPVSLPIKVNTDKCMLYAAMEMQFSPPMQPRADLSAFLGEGGGNHPLVDILNYIGLEIGQPMHAFDRDKLDGQVTIELSAAPEKILALDQKEYTVPAGSLLIKDAKKTIAVAGVIGCANTMVTDSTKRVLIESAAFDPITVRKTAKAIGLSTDASYAFERGTDIEGVSSGLKRLITLTSLPSGENLAQATGYTLVGSQDKRPAAISIELSQIRKQLNLPRLDPAEVSARLNNLGFAPALDQAGKIFTMHVPTWRVWDIETKEDIIEEVARAFSLSKVKLQLPPLSYETPEPNNIESLLSRVEGSFIGNGFIEVITKAFYAQREVDIISELDNRLSANHLAIKNAVDSNYSHLKVTNIVHLANLAEQNHRKGLLSVKVFELCRVFSRAPLENTAYLHERDVLTFAASGRWNDNEWQKSESRELMMQLFKGVLESVIRSTGNLLKVDESQVGYLHPGFQASIRIGKTVAGHFGMAHPLLKERLDLRNDLFYCELDAETLSENLRVNQYTEPSDLPAVRRDITLKIPLQSQAGKVNRIIEGLKLDNLREAAVVDNFRKNEEPFRRVTFRMTFQSAERTLESSEVEFSMSQIIAALTEKTGIELA